MRWALGLTFVLTLWAVLICRFLEPGLLYALLLVLIMWIPGICALFFAKRDGVKLTLFARPRKPLFLAALSALAVGLLVFLLSLPLGEFANGEILATLMPQSSLDVTTLPLFWPLFLIFTLLISALAGVTINMLAALGEELMWRGLLFERLKHLGFLRSSLIIGFIWGAWHAPMIALLGHNYPDSPILGSLMMIPLCMALSPLMTYWRLKGGALMVPAAFHGTLNAVARPFFLFFLHPNPFVVGMTGLVAVVVAGSLSALLAWRLQVKSHALQGTAKEG